VAIGSNTTALKFDELVSCMLSEEMRQKIMEGQSTYTLFSRGCSQKRNRSKFSSGRSKSKGRYKSLRNFVKVCWRCGKERHYKKQCRSKVEKKKRYLKNLLLQKKIPPRKKEGMCTWILQAHMQIMRHGWLTQVQPFI
jgi:hypothetical protein